MLKVDALDRLKELLYYGSDAVEPRNLGAIVGLQQASLKVTCHHTTSHASNRHCY
jgi:hypothetical protein